MRYGFLFQRFEIWLLLAVVGFVVYRAFSAATPEKAGTGSEVATISPEQVESLVSKEPESEEPEGLSVEKVVLLDAESGETTDSAETGQGWIVELTLLGRAPDPKRTMIGPADLVAMTPDGQELPVFFEPFRETPQLAADEDSLVTVRFWLAQKADSLLVSLHGEETTTELNWPEKP